MRASRFLAVTMLSALGVSAVAACGPDDGGSKDAAAPKASASASPSAAAGGLESLSVGDILKKSQAAGAKVTSVKLTFKLKMDASTTMTGAVAEDGKGNCAGKIGFEGKGQADILRQGATLYLKPDTAFLNAFAPGSSAVVGGKYMKLGADAAKAKEFATFCDLGLQTLKQVGQNDDGSDVAGTKSGGKQVDGVKALIIKDQDAGTAAEIAIAEEGEPYVLSLITTGDDQGSMQFSDFDKPVTVTVPPAAQVIDGGKYLG
ncbi:hypothetical protein AB0K51_20590 [Kitasatospora sp. NPDC049285]|uniref:hypothetical protein n=1 Tax=Kitasatospora sp. NPDC049285 TaxID=3157096 RepID=UPI00343132AC